MEDGLLPGHGRLFLLVILPVVIFQIIFLLVDLRVGSRDIRFRRGGQHTLAIIRLPGAFQLKGLLLLRIEHLISLARIIPQQRLVWIFHIGDLVIFMEFQAVPAGFSPLLLLRARRIITGHPVEKRTLDHHTLLASDTQKTVGILFAPRPPVRHRIVIQQFIQDGLLHLAAHHCRRHLKWELGKSSQIWTVIRLIIIPVIDRCVIVAGILDRPAVFQALQTVPGLGQFIFQILLLQFR